MTNVLTELKQFVRKKYLQTRSEVGRQRRVVAKCLATLNEHERSGSDVEENPEFHHALSDYFQACDYLNVLLTQKLEERAAQLDVDLPARSEGQYYKRFFWWGEDDPQTPWFLTSEGLRVARRAIKEGEKYRRENFTFYAAIIFGVVGSVGSLVGALAALNSSGPARVEVTLHQQAELTQHSAGHALPPPIWERSLATDPVGRFFIFPREVEKNSRRNVFISTPGL